MKIKDYREMAGLSQAELAEKVEVNQAAICRWERGANPPLPKYQRKLAAIFGITVDELMREVDQ